MYMYIKRKREHGLFVFKSGRKSKDLPKKIFLTGGAIWRRFLCSETVEFPTISFQKRQAQHVGDMIRHRLFYLH